MPDTERPVPRLVAADTIEDAAAILCCRFGEQAREAERRGRIRGLLRSSRALAEALDQFARNAAPHLRGEHSTSDMRGDVDALTQSLADWTFAVNASAATYRDCTRASTVDRAS